MTWPGSLRASKAREELLATVLVVDDNRDSALAIAQLLELSGHSAIAAFSVREALDVLDERSIDIVLSDIRMPDVDGFDLLRVLRHRFPALPIILMSGLPITSDDVVPQGASVLTKPFTIEDLQGLLQQKLPQRAAT
jgi:CheY-like chemotaxis protein